MVYIFLVRVVFQDSYNRVFIPVHVRLATVVAVRFGHVHGIAEVGNVRNNDGTPPGQRPVFRSNECGSLSEEQRSIGIDAGDDAEPVIRPIFFRQLGEDDDVADVQSHSVE